MQPAAEPGPCHACTTTAIIAYRIKPPNVRVSSSIHWGSEPVTVRACKEHVEAAKKIGMILASFPLSDAVEWRNLRD